MTSFSVFNWKYPVVKVDVTPGYTSQTTGEWIAETTTETAISAHIADVTLKELQYIDPGIVAVGVRKMSCDVSEGVVNQDRIKITEMDDTESEWLVHGKMHSSGLLAKHTGTNRETFLLRRKI